MPTSVVLVTLVTSGFSGCKGPLRGHFVEFLILFAWKRDSSSPVPREREQNDAAAAPSETARLAILILRSLRTANTQRSCRGYVGFSVCPKPPSRAEALRYAYGASSPWVATSGRLRQAYAASDDASATPGCEFSVMIGKLYRFTARTLAAFRQQGMRGTVRRRRADLTTPAQALRHPWARFWIRFGGCSRRGRLSTRIALIGAPQYKGANTLRA